MTYNWLTCVLLVFLWLHLFYNGILLFYVQKLWRLMACFMSSFALIQKLSNDSRDPQSKQVGEKLLFEGSQKTLSFVPNQFIGVLHMRSSGKGKRKLLVTGTVTAAI